jgi:acetoin utilization deacetylase AcuC-like enzyme
MRRIGYISDPRYLEHLTGATHPERPDRLESVSRRIASSGLAGDLKTLPATPADPKWISLVHDPAYVKRVRATCERGDSIIDSMDTGISKRSYEIALLATGAGIAAADALMAGEMDAAFAAVRPPGHHALTDKAMGFCLFNSAAIVARYLQKQHGLDRVLILDWDVHHGNGTQDTFYQDPSVFYFSIHQYPFYPGSGAETATGSGAGKGFTLNAPMAAGCGDDDYREIFSKQFLPAMEAFKPEAVILSAGFDAHKDDPLGGMNISEAGFADMTKMVMEATDSMCPGKLISLLEGGYDLEALASSVETHLGVLLQR